MPYIWHYVDPGKAECNIPVFSPPHSSTTYFEYFYTNQTDTYTAQLYISKGSTQYLFTNTNENQVLKVTKNQFKTSNHLSHVNRTPQSNGTHTQPSNKFILYNIICQNLCKQSRLIRTKSILQNLPVANAKDAVGETKYGLLNMTVVNLKKKSEA